MEMITYLKRRFSSGDLQGEAAEKREKEGLPSFLRFAGPTTNSNPPAPAQSGQTYQPNAVQQTYRQQETYGVHNASNAPAHSIDAQIRMQGTAAASTADETGTSMRRGRATYPSAPTSPTRAHGTAFMGSMSSITGHISNTIMRGFSTAASSAQTMTTGKTKEKQKTLLVIDDSSVDWSKYFKGQRILGEWEIRVEQAQFSDITMTAYSDQGCVINVHQGYGRGSTVRSFKPDFVFLKQHASDLIADWQPILTGLMYSGTPCMNTLHAVYNMKNRPWLFAHLLLLRNRLGKDAFPLITQTYHTNHKELITAPAFPTIIKVGHGHSGEGKIRVDNPGTFQDVTSLLTTTNTYATTEPFLDAKCDIHVQKIGNQYKVFARKSLSGYWKSNTGSAILERIQVNDKFKMWIDEVSRMFGGLDICSVEVLQTKTGEQFIYEVNGSDMALLGESQEEDRRVIADLVIQRMQTACTRPTISKTPNLQETSKTDERDRAPSVGAISTGSLPGQTHAPVHGSALPNQTQPTVRPPNQPPRMTSFSSPSHPVPHPSVPVQVQTVGSSAPAQPPQTHSQQPALWHSFGGAHGATTDSSSVQATGPSYSTWTDHSPTGSAGSSAHSGSSTTFSAAFGNKIDGQSPSGQSTPTPSSTGETSRPMTNDSGFSTFRQTQFSPTTTPNSIYGSSPGGWNQVSTSSDGRVQTSTPTTASFSGRERQRLDSNDSIDRRYDGKTVDRTTGYSAASTGLHYDGNVSNTSCPVAAPTRHVSSPNTYPSVPARQTSLLSASGPEDGDDTMKNLRKTFAGIFGDM